MTGEDDSFRIKPLQWSSEEDEDWYFDFVVGLTHGKSLKAWNMSLAYYDLVTAEGTTRPAVVAGCTDNSARLMNDRATSIVGSTS